MGVAKVWLRATPIAIATTPSASNLQNSSESLWRWTQWTSASSCGLYKPKRHRYTLKEIVASYLTPYATLKQDVEPGCVSATRSPTRLKASLDQSKQSHHLAHYLRGNNIMTFNFNTATAECGQSNRQTFVSIGATDDATWRTEQTQGLFYVQLYKS